MKAGSNLTMDDLLKASEALKNLKEASPSELGCNPGADIKEEIDDCAKLIIERLTEKLSETQSSSYL